MLLRKRMKLPLSFHPEVFRVSYFPQGMEVLLLASSSKDNTRGKVENGTDGFLWLLGLRTGKLYFHLLTSGTRSHLVCQVMPAYSSTPYPNVEDYKGRIGLSPPTAYPST
jgi:hypothetical protein